MSQSSVEGLTIKKVRRMTKDEAAHEGWEGSPHYKSSAILELDDGTLLYASQDDEGNGPGTLFGRKNGESDFALIIVKE